MSRNASVGDVAGTTMKKTLTYLLLLRRSPLPWPRLRRMPPPSGGGGDGVAVGTEGGVADGDQESQQGS